MRTIMPAFERHPKEAEIIGRLLAGYGELEFDLALCAAATMDDKDSAVRVVFRVRGEETRILVTDALMRVKYEDAGLAEPYARAISGMHWCRKLRNQYAHCHWADDDKRLRFTNIEKAARSNNRTVGLTIVGVDLDLLQSQEAFYKYVQDLFHYLYHEYLKLEGTLSSHVFSIPPNKEPPPRHSP